MIEIFITVLVVILLCLVLQVRLIVQGRDWPTAPRPPALPPSLPPQIEQVEPVSYETTKLGRASIDEILKDTYKEN